MGYVGERQTREILSPHRGGAPSIAGGDQQLGGVCGGGRRCDERSSGGDDMKYPTPAPTWRRYLRFWGPSVQSDIDAELRFHFDARISELVSQGVRPEDARAQAMSEFGDI